MNFSANILHHCGGRGVEMLRIYLTDKGVEGYNEGCTCCSSTEDATIQDIDNLLQALDKQTKRLLLLKQLIEKYGEASLVSWKIQSNNIEELKRKLRYAEEYISSNGNIQGTYYKECFDNMDANVKLLKECKKIYNKIPVEFRNYIEQ